MSNREAFVSAIAANPDDDLPRLVFADWLEENGDQSDQARALFIRTQIRWHHAFPDERKELDRKADKLFCEHWVRWFGHLLIALEPGIDLAQGYETRLDVYSAKGLGRPICSPGRIITLSARSLKLGEFPPWAVLGLDVCRGFMTDLVTNLEWWKEGMSLAETFRCEPVSELRCRNGLFSPYWAWFTEPILRRVERLSVYQPWAWHVSAPDSMEFLEDPTWLGFGTSTCGQSPS